LFINLTPLVPLSFEGEGFRPSYPLYPLPLIREGIKPLTTLGKRPDFDSGASVVELWGKMNKRRQFEYLARGDAD